MVNYFPDRAENGMRLASKRPSDCHTIAWTISMALDLVQRAAQSTCTATCLSEEVACL